MALKSIRIKNYRCLHEVMVPTGPINVIFGPNGVGKTSFLDALWFVRDCAIRGTDLASSQRHHGIGVLWDGAAPEEHIEISMETASGEYTVSFGFSSGRIEPFVGELLRSKARPSLTLIDRKIGSDHAAFYHEQLKQVLPSVKLREPEKPALSNYLLFSQPGAEASEVDEILHSLHFYSARSMDFYRLRTLGSESSQHTFLWDRWQNFWSALRNLHGRRATDSRYDTIIDFMRRGFPGAFKELAFDQLGPDRVYASFVEANRRQPIQASGVSDGHLQVLGLLTSLFGESPNRGSILLFDEPETSLHPHAIAIFAEAVKLAASAWNRQIFIATHSPVLLSQFNPEEALAFETGEARGTRAVRLAELPNLQDLLDHYGLGSLYMAEEVTPQSVAQ